MGTTQLEFFVLILIGEQHGRLPFRKAQTACDPQEADCRCRLQSTSLAIFGLRDCCRSDHAGEIRLNHRQSSGSLAQVRSSS